MSYHCELSSLFVFFNVTLQIEEFLEKEEETWPINLEFASVLYDGLKSTTKDNVTDNDRALCGLVPKELDSVSVPGTTYHLFLEKQRQK